MRVTRLGHAALLVETDGARLLVDPGNFSDTWHGLSDLTAVLITHQHHDHVDAPNLAGVVRNNPDTRVLAEEGVMPMLADQGIDASPARPGDRLDFGSGPVEVVGGRHEVIHDKLPRVGNVGYVFSEGGTRLYHPGDSYEYPLERIDVLALPITGPWARVATTADFLAAVRPVRAFPIHDAIISPEGFELYMRMAGELGGEGVDLQPVSSGESIDL